MFDQQVRPVTSILPDAPADATMMRMMMTEYGDDNVKEVDRNVVMMMEDGPQPPPQPPPPVNGEDDDDDDDDDDMMMAFLDEASIVDDVTEQALESITGLYSNNNHNNNSNTFRQVSDSTHETAVSHPTVAAICNKSSKNSKDAIPQMAHHLVTSELPLVLTGRPAIRLYLSCNPDFLSPYQCLVRKNIELFEANECDITSRVKGRNKSIVLGQVGIRCCFCGHVPPSQRDRGSMYFPSNLPLIYQAAQILSQEHLMGSCQFVPPDLRQELIELRQQKSLATVGKEYWAKTAEVLGVFEDQFGLRFEPKLGYVRRNQQT